MTSKEATLLDYSEEGRALLSQQSSAPLEGFATHAVDASIAEFMKNAKNEVEKDISISYGICCTLKKC